MKNLFSILLVGLLITAITACVAREKSPSPSNSLIEADTSALPDDLKLGKFVDIEGARIYALIDNNAPEKTIYVTLDEAMASKTCTIREVGAVAEGEETDQQQEVSGDVNTLLITNTGNQPIFLMAGDLVLGGKQDRILAESVVIDAGSSDQKIPVFCVEQGRWTPQRKDGVAGESGYFTNSKSTGQVDVSVKKAAIGGNEQGQVWDSVTKSNQGLEVSDETESGTFRAAFDNKKVTAKVDHSYNKAKRLVGDAVVGFAVYVDNEPVAMDAFDSVELCNKLSEKLLRSYIVSGMNGGYEETPESEAIASEAIFDAEDIINEDPSDMPNEDLAANPNDNSSDNESPHPNTVNFNTASTGGQRQRDAFFGSRTAAPNTRTSNNSEVTKKAVKYTCKDKKTGKSIQRSFMRR